MTNELRKQFEENIIEPRIREEFVCMASSVWHHPYGGNEMQGWWVRMALWVGLGALQPVGPGNGSG